MLRRLLLAGLTALCATLLIAVVAHAQEPCDPSTDPLCPPPGGIPPWLNQPAYTVLGVSDGLITARHYNVNGWSKPTIDLIEVSDDGRYEVVGRIETDAESGLLHDGFLYTWDGGHFYPHLHSAVHDVRFPAAPVLIAELPFEAAEGGNLAVGSGALYAVAQRSVSTSTVAYDLITVDIRDPLHPAVVAQLPDAGVRRLHVAGDLLLGVTQAGLDVFDISDPLLPSPLGNVTWSESLQSEAWSVAYRDGHAYVSMGGGWPFLSNSCRVVDLANPAQPVVTGSCDPYHAEVAILGDYLYANEPNCSEPCSGIFYLGYPDTPQKVGTIRQAFFSGALDGDDWYLPEFSHSSGAGEHIERYGQNLDGSLSLVNSSRVAEGTVAASLLEFNDGLAFLADSQRITDLRWPDPPHDVSHIPGSATGAWIRNGMLHTVESGALHRYDIHDPSTPVQLPTYTIPAALGAQPAILFGDDGLTYLVGGGNLAIVDGQGYNSVDVGHLALPGEVIAPVWAANRLYLFGAATLWIVDVSVPTTPTLSATLPYGPDLPLKYVGPEGVGAGNQAIYLSAGGVVVTLDIREPLTPSVTLGLFPYSGQEDVMHISGAGDGWLYVTDISWPVPGDGWEDPGVPYEARHMVYDTSEPLSPRLYAEHGARNDPGIRADGRHLLLFSEGPGGISGWWMHQVAPESHSQLQFVAASGVDFDPQVGITYTVASGAIQSAGAAAPAEENACIEQYTESETARLLTGPASHLTPLTAARVVDCDDGAPLEMSEPLLLTIDLAQVGSAFLKREMALVAQWEGSAWVTPEQWLEEGALLHVQLNDLAPWALFGEVGSGIYLPAIVR